MSAVAAAPGARANLSRRKRAGRTVAAALRGGLIGTVAATVAWLMVSVIAGTALVVLVVVSVLAAVYTLARGGTRWVLWAALGAAWAVVLIERWTVHGHGGVWVAAAAWLGVVAAARRAGISKWSLPLLAYPLLSAAVVIAAHEDLLSPWGISWLWVAAVLGPVIGARTLMASAPEK